MNITKHHDFFNPQAYNRTVHIIGCGAIGSNMGHLLTRLGFEHIKLYDFDEVADRNLTNQYFNNNQISETKTTALKHNLQSINPDIIIDEKGKYENQALQGIVILALDSIEERRRIMEENKYNHSIDIVMDLRLGLEEGQAFSAKPDNFENLISTMQFDHDEVESPTNACGSTLTLMPTIQMITALATTNLMNFLKTNTYRSMIFTNAITGQTQLL